MPWRLDLIPRLRPSVICASDEPQHLIHEDHTLPPKQPPQETKASNEPRALSHRNPDSRRRGTAHQITLQVSHGFSAMELITASCKCGIVASLQLGHSFSAMETRLPPSGAGHRIHTSNKPQLLSHGKSLSEERTKNFFNRLQMSHALLAMKP